jgi:SAM-dependent methyltransferase
MGLHRAIEDRDLGSAVVTTFEDRYLSGRELYGDRFSQDEIDAWFEDEREGYADLGAGAGDPGAYSYHALNEWHGFRNLPRGRTFRAALGIGSAYGNEVRPIADRVRSFTILEPSDALVAPQIGDLTPQYVKPHPSGVMPFDDGSFDLVLCFGTLHHIPNISAVLREVGRVVEPGGYALIREPIVSMGDWRYPRKPGVTKRERGIPLHLFRDAIRAAGFEIERSRLCVFPATSRLYRMTKRPPFNSRVVVVADRLACIATRPLYRYHPTARWQKIRPTSLYVVARRLDA